MSNRFPSLWLPRLLFRLALCLSACLILLVIVSPWLDNRVTSRPVKVFARDATLRRTAVASAIGLTVTACVFFRWPGVARRLPPKNRRFPPPPDVAGA
jgi:hypothetical protein